jgi:thiosulfate/3-mercaptopyruvate sulfurtransferase
MSPPLLLEAEQLHELLQQPGGAPADLLIIDLCSEAAYQNSHIPGAVHVNTAELIHGAKPAPGLLPSTDKLNALFSRLGLTPETHVVCYDDEGGAWSGRFLWTLDVIGHPHYSYLNGGIRSWRASAFAEEKIDRQRKPTSVNVTLHRDPVATTEELLRELRDNPKLLVWDARSAEEYRGKKVLSQRGGHIPRAIHSEWTTLLNQEDHLRIRQDAKDYLQSLGITPDKHIVTHCQTHRRSGLTWLVMKILGYPHIRAYPGSWSEWGNRTDTPIELSP